MTIELITKKHKAANVSGRSIATKKARHLHSIPGTKLVRKFIKRAKAEHTPYKDTLKKMDRYVDER